MYRKRGVKMSFSSDLKTELSKINNLKNKDEVFAEFLGYLVTNNITQKGKLLKFSTENEYNINRFAKLLWNLQIQDYKIEIVGKTYNITVKENVENIWQLTEYLGTGDGYFPIDDGLFRRYEPHTLGNGWHGSVEYTFDKDEGGTVMFRNALGTQDRAEYEADKAKAEAEKAAKEAKNKS